MQSAAPVLYQAGRTDNDHSTHDHADTKYTSSRKLFMQEQDRPDHQKGWRGSARNGIDQGKVMITVRIRKQDEVNGFQRHAEDGKQPHGARRQTDKHQCDEGEDAADQHLPAHGNIFFL